MNAVCSKIEKAKLMRYKKSALAIINRDEISRELDEIMENCCGVSYFYPDRTTLLNALDGDEEEEREFQTLFSDLTAKCEQLDYAIKDSYVTEYFDDFMVGIVGNKFDIVGYDTFEEDYFSLVGYDAEIAKSESGKRLSRLTKETLLSVAGQCFGITIAFLDIRYKYAYLKAAFDILNDNNIALLKTVTEINELYDKCNENNFKGYYLKMFNSLLSTLPERCWVE